MLELKLQMFAEEAGDTGADVSAGGAEAAADTEGTAQEQTQGTDDFQTLISGQYRQQYEEAVGKRVQDAIRQRFRNQADLRRQLDSYAPIMQVLGPKYGLDPTDVEGIVKKLTDDDSLYAEEASKRGLPVSTYKNLMRLEAENKRLQQQREQSAEETARQQHFLRLVNQAEELKKTFPDFDLMREMEQNPRFVRMTAPGVGMSVEEAYYAIHGRGIQQQSMQYAAQQAGKAIADSVRSGAARPMEGGMQSTQQARPAVDVAHMDRAKLQEYMRRVKSGERIDFVNNF